MKHGTAGSRLTGPDEICAWFNQARHATLDEDRVAQLYFTFHPRTAFLKTLAPASEVVDIGAGDGSLAVFRSWPEPKREDLKMYAYSIEKGKHFDDFSGYEISDWNVGQPEFGGKRFDAVLCAHFIEHIQDPASLILWAARKLRRGGRIYLEWPSANSLSLPSRKELEERGVPLIISRFDDDHTHRDLPDGNAMAEAMRNSGFTIEARGIVRIPWLEEEMLGHKDAADGFYRQAAFWSRTGWSQYIVAELTGDAGEAGPVPPPRLRDLSSPTPQGQIAELRQSFAALHAAYRGSASRVRTLESELSDALTSLAEERRRMAAEVATRPRLLVEWEEKSRQQSADLENLRRRHEQVLGSRSWRLTKPLRALARLLRRR